MTRYFNRRDYAIDRLTARAPPRRSASSGITCRRPIRVPLSFYHDAKTYGVGPSGYTLPIITERGDKIAIWVSSPEDREAFRDRIRHVEQDLLTVGFWITEAFSRLASRVARRVALTRRRDRHFPLRGDGRRRRGVRSADYLYGSYSTLERSTAPCSAPRTTPGGDLAARVSLLTHAPPTKADRLGSSRSPSNRVVTTPKPPRCAA